MILYDGGPMHDRAPLRSGRHWHCPACQVEWWTTDPTCWSCNGMGRAGGCAPVVNKSASEIAAETAWRLASGLGSAPVSRTTAPTEQALAAGWEPWMAELADAIDPA